jgi:5-formyltetrahydrofolate cyclo-ligase
MSLSSTAEIRQQLRQYLNHLKSGEHEQLVTQAIRHFLQTPEYRRCRNIAAFFPVRHELDLMPLIETCWADNKKVYLPCLLPKPFQKMCFLPYGPKTPMTANRYNIPEPALSIRQQINIHQLDIVITPLLAFGPRGERLGMGGGYYDRTFAFQNRSSNYRRPRLWAIALQAQSRDLTANPWDVNIHGVATEQTVYRYG